MSTILRLSTLALAATIGLAGSLPARAQGEAGTPIGVPLNAPPPGAQATQPVPGDAVDPPGRVGRISDVSGQVWLYHPDGGEWISAQRNLVLTTGDRIATDAGARTQVHVGSTVLRLDGGTELEVLKLDDQQLSLQLHNGSAAVRLCSREAVREFELRTAEGRFTVQRSGRYRFDRADEASHVTVHAGQALYEGPGSALTVNASQRAEFFIDNAGAAQYTITDPERDAFASWSADRDRADDRSASARYVSPEMTGVEDLDRHGRWEQTPDYGPVWAPTGVSAGWAPYTTGRWAWVSPWGWTWVDDAPWGFAPFHYGRWVYYSNRWCWSPGSYVARPVYAPALVAWVGGPRLSVSVSIGGPVQPAVGWVPLAPREVYVPSYRVSPGYVRNVNVTHVTNITNITTIVNNPQLAVRDRDYQNRKYPNAVTVVPTATLAERRHVAPVATGMRVQPAVREIVERSNRDVAIAAPIAPLVRRSDAMPAPQPGVRIEPPGRGRVGMPERRMRDSQPAGAMPAPAAPAMPATPLGNAPAMPRPGMPRSPEEPVRVAPIVRQPAPVMPAVPQAVQPAQPAMPAPAARPAQREFVRPVAPAAQQPPVAAPPVRPQVRQTEAPQMPQRGSPRSEPRSEPAVPRPEVRQAPQPVQPQARPEPTPNRIQSNVERRQERRDERAVRPQGNRAAD